MAGTVPKDFDRLEIGGKITLDGTLSTNSLAGFRRAPADNASATFNGPNLRHDSLIIEADLGVEITARITATIGYEGQLGRDNYI